MEFLNTQNMARSLVRAIGAIALLSSLAAARVETLPHIHAAPSSVSASHCHICDISQPTVTLDGYDFQTSSINISGTKFTPGDPLHVELVAVDGDVPGALMAAGDTTASPDISLPQGNGQDLLVPGGQFSINLLASPDPAIVCKVVQFASVTVVDTATGDGFSSASYDVSPWWGQPGCPVPSIPTFTPTPPAHF